MNNDNKKYVIYTVLVGGYDTVIQPVVTDERFDYVLFSNDFDEKKNGVWQVRQIPMPYGVDVYDNKRLSRYPKTHPETMLCEYEASLYIDANVQIVDKWVYDRIDELSEKHVDYAGIGLIVTGRDCIYRHAYDMCVMRAEHDYNAIEEMHALYKENFPEHFGLNENNIIFRRHNEIMRKVDEVWWEWIVRYSFRDQFSYMYCLWKHSIPINYFLIEGEDARNTSHFLYFNHNEAPNVAKQKWLKMGFWEKTRNKCRRLHYERYLNVWLRLSKLPFPKFLLFIWGIWAGLYNAPWLIFKRLRGLY